MKALRTGNSFASLAALACMLLVGGIETVMADTRSITVTGHGEASAKPDQATVTAGVQTFATTVTEASRANQAVVEKIFAALADHGIPDKNIQTSNYSIWAEQDHGERRQASIVGYRVSNTVSVTIRDIGKVGEILAAVTNAGANTVHGIHFGVTETDALEERARKAAMEEAQARAESLARLSGVELGEVLSITTSAAARDLPRPMVARQRMEMDAAPAPGIAPGEQSIGVWIEARFAIR